MAKDLPSRHMKCPNYKTNIANTFKSRVQLQSDDTSLTKTLRQELQESCAIIEG